MKFALAFLPSRFPYWPKIQNKNWNTPRTKRALSPFSVKKRPENVAILWYDISVVLPLKLSERLLVLMVNKTLRLGSKCMFKVNNKNKRSMHWILTESILKTTTDVFLYCWRTQAENYIKSFFKIYVIYSSVIPFRYNLAWIQLSLTKMAKALANVLNWILQCKESTS